MLRAVVDTNVWISALLNPQGAPARVLEAFLQGRFTPVLAPSLLEELTEVAQRPRLRERFGLSVEKTEQVRTLLRDRGVVVHPPGVLRLCRDPEDNLVLETALLGKAQYMVTRDDDLKRDLELIRRMEEQGVQVLSVRQFLKRLEKVA